MTPPKKILLAEDDEDDRMLFERFLKNRTDIVLLPMAENGEVLWKYLGQCDPAGLPDLIILDQNMPRQNGLQTLEALRQSARLQHIPVVLYSTYVDGYLTRRGEALGARMVYPKPVSAEGYHQMIDTFLNLLC